MHRDAGADRAARILGARAFTFGRHIFFAAGQYQPHTAAGRQLIAHELAHVVQQAEGMAQGPLDRGAAARLEGDADRRAEAALRGTPSGNTTLRPLPEPARPVIQRYAVPGDLRCDELVDWLNTRSPYSPEWAETRCNYRFEGGIKTQHRQLPDGSFEVTARGHRGIRALVDCPIDRPRWVPTPRAKRRAEVAAWDRMLADLGAHEIRHRRIGSQWRSTLEQRARGLDFTVVGADLAEAQGQAQLQALEQQQQWQTEAQTAQDAIDPFNGAVLTCPA